jgi:hypothetical protein
MGHFSNGTEDEDYQFTYCRHCIHDIGQDCPVLFLHLLYGSDQCKDTEVGKALKDVLTRLIPRTKDGVYNEQCRMFIKRP